jgi:dihydroxy-acid dehydratase
MVGHVAPEAAQGGPLAALEDGDTVVIDVDARELRVELPDGELERRLAAWLPQEPRYASGALAKYAALVSSASDGAVTRPPAPERAPTLS